MLGEDLLTYVIGFESCLTGCFRATLVGMCLHGITELEEERHNFILCDETCPCRRAVQRVMGGIERSGAHDMIGAAAAKVVNCSSCVSVHVCEA